MVSQCIHTGVRNLLLLYCQIFIKMSSSGSKAPLIRSLCAFSAFDYVDILFAGLKGFMVNMNELHCGPT